MQVGTINYQIFFLVDEDPVLEDMCELTNTEYDKDPQRMSKKDKKRLIKEFSQNDQTKQYFQSEQAMSNFVNQQLQ